MDAATPIEVSCPCCGRAVVINARLSAENQQDKLMQLLTAIGKNYSFEGNLKCECGSAISLALTVAAN